MQLAAATNDMDIDRWLTDNTSYCVRYRARLSIEACGRNRDHTGEDARCEGCGGLGSQLGQCAVTTVATELRDKPLYLVEKCDEQSKPSEINSETNVLAEELQESLDGQADSSLDPEDDPDSIDQDEPGLDLDGSPLELSNTSNVDAFTLALLATLQGEEDEDLPLIQREARTPKERRKRVRVYVGRCMRCDGYMFPAAKEYRGDIVDDEVYRCFNCGWHTSPAYEYNRKHPGEGWR